MHALNLVAMITFAVASAFGCARSTEETVSPRVDCEITPRPPVVGRAHLDCVLMEADGSRLTEASAALEANMTHPGMSPVRSRLREVTPGRYEGRFDLTMPGDWYVRVFGRANQNRRFEFVIDLPGVQGAP